MANDPTDDPLGGEERKGANRERELTLDEKAAMTLKLAEASDSSLLLAWAFDGFAGIMLGDIKKDKTMWGQHRKLVQEEIKRRGLKISGGLN